MYTYMYICMYLYTFILYITSMNIYKYIYIKENEIFSRMRV